MDIAKFQALYAPFLTPAAPAMVFGAQLNQGMIAAGLPWYLALLGACLGIAGMEMSGALMCSMAVKAYARRQWTAMLLAILGAIMYAVFVMAGVYTAKNSQTFVGLVLITLIAYLGSGLWQWMNDYDRIVAAHDTNQISRTKAQASLISAQARLAKVSSGVHQTNGQAVQRPDGQMDSETGRKVRAWFVDHAREKPSLRDCANALHISPETARKYKP